MCHGQKCTHCSHMLGERAQPASGLVSGPTGNIQFQSEGTSMTTKLRAATIALAVAGLCGCHTPTTYKATVTNPQGKSTTCETSGHGGLLRGLYAKQAFDECVAAAKEPGAK